MHTNALLSLIFPLLLKANLTIITGCVLSLLALYSLRALLAHLLVLGGRCHRAGALSDSSTALERDEVSAGSFSSPLHPSSHRFAL